MGLNASELAELKQLQQDVASIDAALITHEQQGEIDRCKASPWYWLQKYVYTLDEKDIQDPIKKYPDFPYLEHICDLWMAYPYVRFLAIEKSRRTLQTLTFMALFTWDAQFFDGRQNIVVSTNDEKAKLQLRRRSKIFYDNQPEWLKKVYPAKFIDNKAFWWGKEDVPTSNKEATSIIW